MPRVRAPEAARRPPPLLSTEYDIPCLERTAMPDLLRAPLDESLLRFNAVNLANVRLRLPARGSPLAVGDECDLLVRVTGRVVRGGGSGALQVVVSVSGVGDKCVLEPPQFAYALFIAAMGIHSCYEEDDGCDDTVAGKATMAALRDGKVALCLSSLCSDAALESAAHSFYLCAGQHGLSRGHRISI